MIFIFLFLISFPAHGLIERSISDMTWLWCEKRITMNLIRPIEMQEVRLINNVQALLSETIKQSEKQLALNREAKQVLSLAITLIVLLNSSTIIHVSLEILDSFFHFTCL